MRYEKYEPEILKKLQEIELSILKDFINICKENNLTYFLYGGTLLGAVRHHGFIPWDDDIDVIMFKEDYEKFIKIMKNSHYDKYKLITPMTYDNYFLLFSKLTLKGTKFEEWWGDQVDFEINIFIDIFVLDNVSDNKLEGKIQVLRARLNDRLATLASIKLEGYPLYIQIISSILYFFFNLLNISPMYFKKRALKILKEHDNEDTQRVVDISALKYAQIYQKKDFFPVTKIDFEGIEVNIPGNYDKLLTQIYGDYMKLPPKEKRYNHMPKNLNFGKYK